MARAEDLLFKPAQWTIVATNINGIAYAEQFGIPGKQHFIVGLSISCSGLPATSVQVLIRDNLTILDQWEIPPAQFAPMTPNFIRPYVGSPGGSVNVILGAMGAGIRGTVCMRGFTSMAG